jgi:hypothetical protein
VYAKRVHVSAATTGEPYDIFTLFQAKASGAASVSAVPGCLKRTAIAQGINYLDRIDEVSRVYPHFKNFGPFGDIAVYKNTAARTACKGRLTGLRRALVSRKESAANRNEG